MSDARMIESESGVSLFDGKPFVVLRWGNESCQFSPQEARTFALHIIETADSAVFDASLASVLETGMGLALETRAAFLDMIRSAREQWETP